MSIASEITSMGENLKKDYQSIANLGADLTNVDKNIENIAELLDGVYDVLPKTEFQEGTEVTIEGGLKGKIDFENDIVGIGQSSQSILPSGYQQVEYIESTGTQYIDTGVIGKNIQTSFECKCTFSSVYGGSAVNSTGGLHYILDGDATLRTGGASSGYSYTLNQVITIKAYYNAQNRRTLDVDGTLACTGTAYNSSDANILIFRLADTSTQKGRLYWFKIYNDNELVFDGIPCYRISDNVIGLYDTVNNVFHTNSGTGTFTKGTNAPTPNAEIPVECVTGNQEIVVSDGNNNSITYPISLGSNKFYSIGDYADELLYDVDEDKVYKKARTIEQVVTSQYLSNLAVFQLQSINSYGIANFLLQNFSNTEEGQYSYEGMCNYFSRQESVIANTQTEGILYQPRNVYVRIKSTTASTTQEFADYADSLNTSGNSLKIYRPIETPVLTEITDTTLKAQVKAWYYAQSINGTTIIESNGDLPMIIKVRALKGE